MSLREKIGRLMGQLTVATDPQLLSLLVHYLRGICSQSCCSCHKKMGTEQAHLEGECWFACWFACVLFKPADKPTEVVLLFEKNTVAN